MDTKLRNKGWWMGLGLLLTVLLVGGGVVLESHRRAHGRFAVYGEVANFALTNQLGQAVSLDAFRGKVWVADIIFTRCAGPCPKLTATMAQLARVLGGRSSTALVSLTADPEYDTPEVLRRYGEPSGAVAPHWMFLTGPRAEIRRMAVESLKLVVVERKEAERQDPSDLFLHSTLLVIIDRHGRIRGYQQGLEPDAVPKVLAAVEQLSREE